MRRVLRALLFTGVLVISSIGADEMMHIRNVVIRSPADLKRRQLPIQIKLTALPPVAQYRGTVNVHVQIAQEEALEQFSRASLYLGSEDKLNLSVGLRASSGGRIPAGVVTCAFVIRRALLTNATICITCDDRTADYEGTEYYIKLADFRIEGKISQKPLGVPADSPSPDSSGVAGAAAP